MKKSYSKPQIMFDSFELSESIAGSCKAISNQALGVCKATINTIMGEMNVFTDSAVCSETSPDALDMICYNVHNYENVVFSS